MVLNPQIKFYNPYTFFLFLSQPLDSMQQYLHQFIGIFNTTNIGNYIQGYKLALGKKVNNLPPLTTSKPIFLAPAGVGCHNPSF